MSLNPNFEYSISDESETGLTVLTLTDKKTGIVVNTIIPNSKNPVASIQSYVASRYSRSSDTVIELLSDLVTKKQDSVKIMGKIFRDYGHASVADMAGVFVYIENIPSLYATRFFMESSVGAGMERSTRYQDFGKNIQIAELCDYNIELNHERYEPLNTEFMNIQNLSLELYNKWYNVLYELYQDKYNIDVENKNERDALKARTFDSARSFLPWGSYNRTSLGYLTSAREWSRLISLYKGEKDPILKQVGEMLELLLAPEKEIQDKLGFKAEVYDLIRYTQGVETTSNNLDSLRQWLDYNEHLFGYYDFQHSQYLGVSVIPNLSGVQKMILGYIYVLNPFEVMHNLDEFVQFMSPKMTSEILKIISKNHTHHNQLPIMARTGDYMLHIDCPYSEVRDLNRHRSFGRYCPMVLSDSPECSTASKKQTYILPDYIYYLGEDIIAEFKNDLKEYTSELTKLEHSFKNYPKLHRLLKQVWLFAVNSPFVMMGGIKEIHYLTHQRVRPGGHINYRHLMRLIRDELVEHDESLIHIFPDSDVDTESIQQFKDRS